MFAIALNLSSVRKEKEKNLWQDWATYKIACGIITSDKTKKKPYHTCLVKVL